MARYRITAPVKHVSGMVADLVFVESVAETDSVRALAYFRRHGYAVEEIVAGASAEEPEASAEAPAPAPALEDETPPMPSPADPPAPAKAAKTAKSSHGGTA